VSWGEGTYSFTVCRPKRKGMNFNPLGKGLGLCGRRREGREGV